MRQELRRSISFSLIAALISWLLIAPLFAMDTESSVPACCRRAGKHHCAMRGMERLGGGVPGFRSVSEKCPLFPASTGAVHHSAFKPEAGGRFSDEVVLQPVLAHRILARVKTSFSRSHQKRGPPAPLA